MATTLVIPQYPGSQQQTVVPLQTVTTNTSTTNAAPTTRYNRKAGLVTGIMQLVIAGIQIIMTAVVLSLGTDYRVAWGIWATLMFYGITGILGVSSKNGIRSTIIGYLVMCILSAIIAPCHMIYEAVASSNGGDMECGYDWYYCDKDEALAALHAIAAIAAAIEILVAIVAAAFCCAGGICACCCTSSATPTQTIVVQYVQPPAAPTVTHPGYPQGPAMIHASYPPPHHAQGPPPAYESTTGQAAASSSPTQDHVYQELIKGNVN